MRATCRAISSAKLAISLIVEAVWSDEYGIGAGARMHRHAERLVQTRRYDASSVRGRDMKRADRRPPPGQASDLPQNSDTGASSCASSTKEFVLGDLISRADSAVPIRSHGAVESGRQY